MKGILIAMSFVLLTSCSEGYSAPENVISGKYYYTVDGWGTRSGKLPPMICEFCSTGFSYFQDSCKKYNVGDIIKKKP